MSDSDSQNISAQDYDDAVEATPTDASSANSTGTADEVGSHDGWVGEDGPRRGKSPRMVVAQYPPATREALLAELPPRPAAAGPVSVPHSLELSSSQPSASSWGELIPLNNDDVRNHPCLLTLSKLEETKALLTGRVEFQTRRYRLSPMSKVFRSPESVAAADLEPPDYSQPRKYVPKKMTGSSTAAPTTEPAKQGMVLERSFAPAPTGPKKPRLKVRAVIPTREAIRDLETDKVGEMIAQSVLWLSHMTNDLFCRAKAAENVALEARIASAEQEVEAAKRETAEMNEKMSSYANLSDFLCRDPREAEAFFRAFIHKEVGEELAWRYGEWAYAKGRYEMQQAVREALEESLNEKDFATVMGVMPDSAPAPGPMPYADPVPGDDAPAPAKVDDAPAPAKTVPLATGGLAEPARAEVKRSFFLHVGSRPRASVFSTLLIPNSPGAYGRRRSSRPQAESGLHRPMAGRGLIDLRA
nr:leucine zipper putative tumor suppressor 2-like [Ipomoea batatas]